MNSEQLSITFEIPNDIYHVSMVGISVSALCKEHQLGDEFAYQLQTCIVEALNNVIIHGYENQENDRIRIIFSLHSDATTVQIVDRGVPYTGNLTNHSLKMEDSHGRGWFIIEQWSDAIRYTTEEGSNRLTITKNFKK